tara:strand:+ start:72 stop:536 length:465 start_codon:yes stop_codon:yes gene_type:complete
VDENTIVLIMILGFGFVFILIGINAPQIETKNKTIKPSEKVKEEAVKKEVIDKKVVKEEIKKEAVITQPIKQENKIFNLRNLGWVSFAVVMFLLLSRDNDKTVYSINELGLSAEMLRYDNDFQIAVLYIIEENCWVVVDENHRSGYGRRIQCYK